MNKQYNYLMALAMNSDVATLRLSDVRGTTDIPVKITEVNSEGGVYTSPMTTFKCLVVNDDQIKVTDRSTAAQKAAFVKAALNDIYGARRSRTYSATNPAFEIDRVIFNNPATIVLWRDGTKTVVKCQEGDVYSKETGLALCIAKKALGNKGNFNDIFRKWIPEEEDEGEAITLNINLGDSTFCDAAQAIKDAMNRAFGGAQL